MTKVLVVPDMEKRLLKRGFSKPLQQSISLFAGVATVAEIPPSPDDNIPRRCQMCLNENHGDGHKEAKKSIGKVKSRCLSETYCFAL